MKRIRFLSLLLVLLLMLAMTGVAAAQAGEPPPEDGGTEDGPTEVTVEGRIVGVDLEAGTIDIEQEDGTIVTIEIEVGDYDHPIVRLLTEYFGGAGIEEWADALDTLDLDEGIVIEIAGVENEDGVVDSWEITLEDGTVITTDDEELADALTGALDTLDVSLDVMDDGEAMTLPDIGEQIEAYHEAGIGFGELVKIYTIALESQEACEAEAEEAGTEVDADCAVTVEELAQMVLDGVGMGYLFDLYGRPSLLGVGHVRQAMGGSGVTIGSVPVIGSGGGDSPSGDDGGGGGGGDDGICNARAHGGSAHAHGHGEVDCP